MPCRKSSLGRMSGQLNQRSELSKALRLAFKFKKIAQLIDKIE
jgi:hypothetical protein